MNENIIKKMNIYAKELEIVHQQFLNENDLEKSMSLFNAELFLQKQIHKMYRNYLQIELKKEEF